MRKHLKRRTFLRGALGGGIASIALPPLDAMMNLEQTAFADGSSQPRRYVSWFRGNGFILDRFEPIGAGADWQLNDHMTPLAGVKDYLNVVTGLTNRCKETITHHEGMTVFNGYTMVDIGQGQGFFSNSGGPTIDVLISDALAGQTPIASVHLGASKAQSPADEGTTMHNLSHRGHLQPNAAITNPSAAWQSLFGSFVQPKDDRELRLHILDSVKGEVSTLQSRLGAEDKVRLEAHLDSIAALEAKLMTATPVCELPMDPMFDNSDAVNNEQLTLVNELMSDLLCYAFSCDLTRVATMLFLEGAAEPSLGEVPGNDSSWHQYSHNVNSWDVGGPFDNGQYYLMERFGYLLTKMRDTIEFDGTNLLDNSIVLMSSDASDGSVHSIQRHPMILAGAGGGYLKYPGIHYQPEPLSGNYSHGSHPGPTSGNTTDVLMSIMRAFDDSVSWIGEQPNDQGEGAGSGTPLTEILA
ncbi:hypothetical protein ENSA5_69910 [Enhygromyxa salina]|uniref:Tat (Twin-arginine translocation) pathway signal sequence domain protein n=1 Tax=Enhygromyxa salina TaxID=215803 RepID=A0A2S9XAK5_9BACT|nr:DUF1552 domain-containing protein [Enhygromyxa salina]PRP89885.1 hypothetical protein ENSA5_69910 [Enhygromyxa salina]